MADIDIPQPEAGALIAREKRFVGEKDWIFPAAGERIALALTSIDKREKQYYGPIQDAARAVFISVAEIEKLLHDYRAWLRDKSTLREINGEWVEITTPYLDRHNDALQIYARAENGGYVLTDDSFTLHDLEASGCKLDSEKRKDFPEYDAERIRREAPR